jgi:hypothetical protein
MIDDNEEPSIHRSKKGLGQKCQIREEIIRLL